MKYKASACLFDKRYIYVIAGYYQNNYCEKYDLEKGNKWIVIKTNLKYNQYPFTQ